MDKPLDGTSPKHEGPAAVLSDLRLTYDHGETWALDGIPISRMDGDLGITVFRKDEEIDRAAFNYIYDPAGGAIKLLNTIRPE